MGGERSMRSRTEGSLGQMVWGLVGHRKEDVFIQEMASFRWDLSKGNKII